MLITSAPTRRRLLAAMLALPVTALAACGGTDSPAAPATQTGSSTPALNRAATLVLYNAQHDTLTKAWVEGFTAAI